MARRPQRHRGGHCGEHSQPLFAVRSSLAARFGSHSVYFQRGHLIRASSCQRFVSVPLLSPSHPSPLGVRGIRQMNTFKSESTQTDNSPTAMPPPPLGRDMVVLYLISPTPGAQYRAWPRLRMWWWRQRSPRGSLENTCTLQ